MAITAMIYLSIVVGGTFLCFYKHPVWGIYTYVIVFYMDAPSRWWGASLPNLRWSLLIVAITVIATVLHESRKHGSANRPSFLSHAPHSLFISFVALMYIQYLWKITDTHTQGVVYFTKYIIAMYLVYSLVDNRERIIGFLTAHVLGCFYLGFLAFVSGGGGRLDGVGGAGIDDANSLGMYMATATIAAGGLYFGANNWLRFVPIVALPFTLNTLVQAGSRGAFLALVVGCVAVYFYRPRRTTMKLWAYGAVGLVLFGFLASDYFWERMASIKDAAQQTEAADTSATSRIQIIKDQWRMAVDHPLGTGHKGTGTLSYQYIAEEYWSATGGRSSHNTFMSVLVDQGFLGLFLWLALSWKIFQKCRAVAKWAKRDDDTQLGWLVASILGILVVIWTGGLFAPFLKAEVFIWMIALVCSLWADSVGKKHPASRLQQGSSETTIAGALAK